ncbi:DUF397 domain-containing protein [Actinomadura formosensis]|uniref:DUF397 domain-containing protein n=1 Tax=Actinomadura formosensis TaxID=60706 RepID=UPI003D91E501
MILAWRKSSYSGGADDSACIEVAGLCGGVAIRDSKDPEGGLLVVRPAALRDAIRLAEDAQGAVA